MLRNPRVVHNTDARFFLATSSFQLCLQQGCLLALEVCNGLKSRFLLLFLTLFSTRLAQCLSKCQQVAPHESNDRVTRRLHSRELDVPLVEAVCARLLAL